MEGAPLSIYEQLLFKNSEIIQNYSKILGFCENENPAPDGPAAGPPLPLPSKFKNPAGEQAKVHQKRQVL